MQLKAYEFELFGRFWPANRECSYWGEISSSFVCGVGPRQPLISKFHLQPCHPYKMGLAFSQKQVFQEDSRKCLQCFLQPGALLLLQHRTHLKMAKSFVLSGEPGGGEQLHWPSQQGGDGGVQRKYFPSNQTICCRDSRREKSVPC